MMFLGIDIGTSAVKLCLTDADGALAGTAQVDLPISHPVAGASEQSGEDWIRAIEQAASSLDARARSSVVGIGLSGQMHGAVLLDAAQRPIRPVILWNDSRAAAEAEALRADLPDVAIIAGAPPVAGFTAPKLRWLAHHAPEDHARIAHVLLPKDYVGLYLHGALATDPSDAAGSGWFDQAARAWSPAVCAASDTDPAWLPPVLDGTQVAGTLRASVAAALGLPEGIPVATGAGDAAAGAVGIGAVDEGDGFISLGTSGQVFVTTDAYRPNPGQMLHAYAHTLPARWFQMAAMLNGARPMAWMAGHLGRPVRDLLAEAETAAPGPLFLPYLTGERTPHNDAAIRAGFWGLSEETSHGSLMRAVVEGIAFSFADAADVLREAGTRPDHLLAVGGGAQSDFLLQMVADMMNQPIGRSDNATVGPALGAARLGQIAAGHGTIPEVARKPEVTRWFTPDPARAEALAPRLAGFRALYPALASVSAAIDGASGPA